IAAARYLRLIPSGLSGTGGGNVPVKPALSAHPCASPRPEGKRLSDLQPDQGIAASQSLRFENLYRFCLKS
ncbi:hypothetical protein ACQKOC_22910, partial [Enterobacter mori]|uniref:hypothetical protein n=1 Tax=Enterobacter mori TaxID=539813 RepID=UPI003CFC0961